MREAARMPPTSLLNSPNLIVIAVLMISYAVHHVHSRCLEDTAEVMRSKSLSSNSPEQSSEGYAKENAINAEAMASYNQLISNYIKCPRVQTHCCVSNVGDGTFLLKATISPLPPLTGLISEEEWLKLVQTMKCTLQESPSMEKSFMENSTGPVEGGSKTPLSDTGTNNLVDPIKESPPPSPGRWTFSPRHESSSSHSPIPRYDMEDDASARHRRSLKVRFHRKGVDEYEVVGSVACTSAGESSEGTSKQSNKKSHKKAKKTKKRRESMDLDNVAYMIDESHLVANRGSESSAPAINGSNDAVVPNGDVHVKDLNCSLSKKEKNQNSMNAMATWPTKSGDAPSKDDGGAEASVTHHIWKKKQRRGEPVVKTSYVRRQGTPVSCTINLRSRSVPRFNELQTNIVPRRSSERLRSRYSLPPPSSRCQRPRRATKSASPHHIRHSRYEPVYPEENCIIYCPSMNTRSRDPKGTGRNGLTIIKKEDDADGSDRQVVSPSGNNKNTSLLNLKIVKQECEDLEDNPPPSSTTFNEHSATDVQEPSKSTRVRRTSSRPKKLRPRAGRRTGERVASDEELPPDAASAQKSVPSSDSSQEGRDAFSAVADNGDTIETPEYRSDNRSMSEEKHEVPSEVSSVDTGKGSPSDGLYIDEEEPISDKSGNYSEQSQNQEDGVFRPKEEIDAEDMFENEVKSEPVSIEGSSQAVGTKEEYDMTEAEKAIVDGSAGTGLITNDHRKLPEHPLDQSIAYRYKMWSNAYRTFRVSPFLIPPNPGQIPQLVRYPPRHLSEVRTETRDEKCYVKLGAKYEVAVANPPKMPNERNWKEIYVGDVLWVRWRKNEYWPATAYNITDTAPIKVTVLWINDRTESTVDYTMVDSFDMAFHIRYDARRGDAKYVKAVATALRYMGKMGFWECHITAKVYHEIIKEEGESFCRHILPEELQKIKSKARAPKVPKEAKKDDQTRLQRSEEILQALQASHFIDIYQRSPLVGNALPLTQQIVDDYQGSKEYASGNLDPLFVDGTMLCFDEDVKAFGFDPEVMGSNEIVQWDGDSGITSSGYDTTDASLGSEAPPDDSDASAHNANARDVDTKEEEFPQPFSEIDALRLTNPEKLPPKKRHGTRSVTPKPAPKKKRQ
ncbi:hypothetical protein Y032_0185g1021 [Ancylostoma ceylanicum]|nr:hypothetical protein Y032_0185g1021 [Ancylostoma ceylanicum]